MLPPLECPTSPDRIDERIVRMVALQVSLLAGLTLVYPSWVLAALLVYDFGCRAWGYEQYSLLRALASRNPRLFGPVGNPVDKAPKVFAARLGFLMACLLLGTTSMGWVMSGIGISMVFLALASLEAWFAICVGCHVYTLLRLGR